MISFTYTDFSEYTLIEFITNTLAPAELQTISPPDAVKLNFAHKGIVLSGKGPVWLYGFLVHFYHPAKWIAVFDPRLQGAVVVQSHAPEKNTGDIVPVRI